MKPISPTELRAEGVLELGCVGGTLFVLTNKCLHLFHVLELPQRKLDAWGVARAIDRLRSGQVLFAELAHELGIHKDRLREDLYAAGVDPRLLIQRRKNGGWRWREMAECDSRSAREDRRWKTGVSK